MDDIARWVMATQGVIVEAAQVHVFGCGGGIQRIQAAQDTRVKPRAACDRNDRRSQTLQINIDRDRAVI